ncbi:MAG: hypothetical protein ABEJ87_03625 [Candidatus Nanohalobium sp.]
MDVRKSIIAIALIISITASGSAYSSSYKGDIQVKLQKSQNLQAGNQLQASITASNAGKRPIVDGYIVVDVVKGSNYYYPSQQSNKNNIIHEEKIGPVNLKENGYRDLSYTYTLPSDLKSGDYMVNAYFKTNRTPVSGRPFIFSSPTTAKFTVDGSGNYPGLEISRTGTVLTGSKKEIGDWNPNSLSSTKWPSLTGPVGVLATDSMDHVSGSVVIQNHGSSTRNAQVKLKVCEWDDTSCNNQIDTVTKDVTVSSSGKTVPVSVKTPSKPSAYAVKIMVTSNGRTESIYRNRIIREGNTARIRKMSVNRPYISRGGFLSVGLIAGASPDHYTDPAAKNVKASVTVKTIDGKTVLDMTKNIEELSNNNVLQQLYFNKTVTAELNKFRVTGQLSSNGETYDQYSYVVDYSKFRKEADKITLKNYEFTGKGLNVNLCARTDAGTPARDDVKAILTGDQMQSKIRDTSINGCKQVSYSNISKGNYKLLVNHGTQSSFQIKASGPENKNKEENNNNGGLPMVPIAGAVVIVLIIAGALLYRGGNR